MITATATTANTANRRMSRSGRLPASRLATAFGAWLTMPAKMMKLMPLPIPFSVMSSPSHMRSTAPATIVTIWTHDIAFPRPKPPMMTPDAFSADRMPNAWRKAIGTVR
ncbi:MAG: hypothetical protein HW391_1097 [Chloroflexi bacterium]|nr:hypothetical protein [Chloroflexota bacterium]